jgi:hypothetical protein
VFLVARFLKSFIHFEPDENNESFVVQNFKKQLEKSAQKQNRLPNRECCLMKKSVGLY